MSLAWKTEGNSGWTWGWSSDGCHSFQGHIHFLVAGDPSDFPWEYDKHKGLKLHRKLGAGNYVTFDKLDIGSFWKQRCIPWHFSVAVPSFYTIMKSRDCSVWLHWPSGHTIVKCRQLLRLSDSPGWGCYGNVETARLMEVTSMGGADSDENAALGC